MVVEAIIPLPVTMEDDSEEVLTPSHLIYGQKILNFPDYFFQPEEDEYPVNRAILRKGVRYTGHTDSH